MQKNSKCRWMLMFDVYLLPLVFFFDMARLVVLMPVLVI